MADGGPTKRLTHKQSAFVDAYVGEAKGNATKAARLAGYEGSDITLAAVGYENLRKPQVASAISDRASEYAMSPAEILGELADIARNANLHPLVDAKLYGKPTFNLVEEGESGEQKPKPEMRYIKKMTVTDESVSIEMYDRVAALVQLGKYHRLWVERQELSGPGGMPIPLALEDLVQARERVERWERERFGEGEAEGEKKGEEPQEQVDGSDG